MSNTILCVSISNLLTHMAEVAVSRDSITILRTHSFATPDDGLDLGGTLRVTERMVDALKENIKISGIEADSIAFSVMSSHMHFANTKIPNMPDDQIQSHLNSSFDDLFPLDRELYTLNYSIQKEDSECLYLDVFAIPNFMIKQSSPPERIERSYEIIADFLGMKFIGLVDSTYGLICACRNDNSIKYLNNVIINIDEDLTDIVIIKEGRIAARKRIRQGVSPLINKALRSGLSMYDDNVVNTAKVLTNIKELKEEGAEANKLVSRLKSEMESLISKIEEEAIELCRKHNFQINSINLAGLGADFPWLVREITMYLGVPVHTLPSNEINGVKNLNKDYCFHHAISITSCAASREANLMDFGEDEKALKNLLNAIVDAFLNK